MSGPIIHPPEWSSKKTPDLAPQLLGQYLIRKDPQGTIHTYHINEIEIYHGLQDRASHAHRGRTPRNEVMFGPPGHWYVYLCYGVHWLLNLVTGPPEFPAALLIRGVEGISGPGRLTKKLQIDGSLNRQPAHPDSGLWIARSERPLPRREIVRSPRIGIAYAGAHWAQKPWRWQWNPPQKTPAAKATGAKIAEAKN